MRRLAGGAADGEGWLQGEEAALQPRFSFQVWCSQDLHAMSWMWFAPRAISTAVKFQQMNNVVFNKFHRANERILTRSCCLTLGLKAFPDPNPFTSSVFPVGPPGPGCWSTPELDCSALAFQRSLPHQKSLL